MNDFPEGFLLEVNGVVPDGTIKTFGYSEFFKFETEEEAEAEIYSIAYELNSGELAEGVTNPEEYTVESEDFTLNNPSREGYTFLGWTYEDKTEPQTEVTIIKGSTGDKCFTANWVENAPNTYSLDVVKGKGIDTVSGNGRYEAGKEVTVGCTLLEGYENAVWSGCSTEATFEMPANNATMTVNATPISYSITYTLVDGATLEGGCLKTTFLL